MGSPRTLNKVRFVPGSGFEMQCRFCLIYVPLTEEEWEPDTGLARCRSCKREYKRLHEAGRRGDEIKRELMRTKAQLRYRFNRTDRLARNRVWREANRERIAAYNKAYREAHRDASAAQSRAYYAECRDVILVKKRQAYAEKAA